MEEFFNSLPMIRAMFPSLGEAAITAMNRLGQVVIILVGIQVLYRTSVGDRIRRQLSWLFNFHGYIRQSIGNLSAKADKWLFDCELPICILFSLILVYLLVFVTHCGPFAYLLYPFDHVWDAILIWARIELRISVIFATLLHSIGLCVWAVISFICIYGFFLGITTQAVTKTSQFIATRYSILAYQLMVAMETITGTVILLFTTASPFKK